MILTRRGSVLSYAGATYASALSGLITGPLLARALAPSGRGQVAAVTVFAFALPVVLSLGFPWAIGQRAAIEPNMRASLFGSALRFSLLTILPALIASFAILAGPLNSIAGGARVVALITFAVAPLSVLVYALQRILVAEGALGTMALLQTGTLATNAVITVALFLSNSLTVTSYLVASLVVVIGNALATILAISDRPKGRYPMGPLVGFGVKAFPGALAGIANARLDQLMMVPFLGSAQLGLYAVSVSISSIPLSLGGAIAARSYGQMAVAPDRAREAARYVRLSVLVGGLACLAVAGIAPFAVPILYGPTFRDAVFPLLTLLPGVVALSAITTSSAVLVLFDRPGVSSIAEGVGIAITVTGLWLFLRSSGIVGAALISSASYLCTLLVHVAFLRRLGITKLTPRREDVAWIVGRAAVASRRRRFEHSGLR